MYHFLRISGNAVSTQSHQMTIQLFIIGRDRSAFSAGHCLHRMEAKAGHISQAAYRLSLIRSADGMCRILYEEQVMLLANCTDLIQFHCLTGEIYRNNSLGPRGDQLANRCRIDIIGLGIDVCEYRLSPCVQYAVGGCRKSDGAYDNLISLAESCCQCCQMQCCRTVAYHYRIFCMGQFTQMLLQFLHFRSAGDQIAGHYCCHRIHICLINILSSVEDFILSYRFSTKNS